MPRSTSVLFAILLSAGCSAATSGYELDVPSTTELAPGLYRFEGTVLVRDQSIGGSSFSGPTTSTRTVTVRGTVEVREDGARRLVGSSHRGTQLSISPRSQMGRISVLVPVTRVETGVQVCAWRENGRPDGRCLRYEHEVYERTRDQRFSGTAYIVPQLASR